MNALTFVFFDRHVRRHDRFVNVAEWMMAISLIVNFQHLQKTTKFSQLTDLG